MSGHWLGSGIDFDAGQGSCIRDNLRQWGAVGSLLAQGFIKQNDTGNMLAHGIIRPEKHFAIIAAIIFGRVDIDTVKALFDGAGAFIGGKNAFAVRHHCLRDCFQCLLVHLPVSSCSVSASTPGSFLPSSHSKNAPPAVDT